MKKFLQLMAFNKYNEFAIDYTILGNWKRVDASGKECEPQEGATLLALGDLGSDGKYHITIEHPNGDLSDIVLDEPLRKVDDTVYDTLEMNTEDGQATVKVTRNVRAVDLGTLDYTYTNSSAYGYGGYHFNANLVNPYIISGSITPSVCSMYIKGFRNSLIYEKYNKCHLIMAASYYGRTLTIANDTYSNVDEFKSAMSGVLLFYKRSDVITEEVTPTRISFNNAKFNTQVQPSSVVYTDHYGEHTLI